MGQDENAERFRDKPLTLSASTFLIFFSLNTLVQTGECTNVWNVPNM